MATDGYTELIETQNPFQKDKNSESQGEVSEIPFNSLTYKDGQNLNGPYQSALLSENRVDEFQRCKTILLKNICNGKHTFSEKSWQNYYWIAKDETGIFRRKKR